MKNFFTEINQSTIERQQMMFGKLFAEAVADNPDLLTWISNNWQKVFKKKSDQDFLRNAIQQLENMSKNTRSDARKNHSEKTAESTGSSTSQTAKTDTSILSNKDGL